MRFLHKQELDISIVMPCLNEEKTVGSCVRDAFRFISGNDLSGAESKHHIIGAKRDIFYPIHTDPAAAFRNNRSRDHLLAIPFSVSELKALSAMKNTDV